MTKSQQILCDKISKFIFKHDVIFAGIDLIGEKIGEINITSPTGLRYFEKLTGQNITASILKQILSN